MRLLSLLSVSLLSICCSVCAEQYTTLIDKKGRSLEVSLLSHSSTHVSCIKKGGDKTLNIPLRLLSPETVESVKEFPILSPKVTVRKERDAAPGESASAFGVSNVNYLKGSIIITNKTPQLKAGQSRGQIYLLGSGRKNGDQYHTIIDEMTFNFIPSKKPEARRIEEIEVPQGLQYKGYVFFITDEQQRIITADTSIPELKSKLTPKLLEALTQLDTDAELSTEFLASSL